MDGRVVRIECRMMLAIRQEKKAKRGQGEGEGEGQEGKRDDAVLFGRRDRQYCLCTGITT